MILFTNLKATDCFSYRELNFNFETGLHSISGLNGSSKTSIFLTLQQGLFNRNSKGCKVEECNNSITKKPYEIEVRFTKGADSYKVLNSRKKGCIKLFKNDKDISLKRIPDVLKQIEEVLECDFQLFTDLTYQAKSSTLNILDSSTNKGRSEFVNRILKLYELDAHLARLQEKRKELESKNGTIARLQEAIKLTEASLVKIEEVEREKSETDPKIAELEEQLTDLKELKIRTEMQLKQVDESLKIVVQVEELESELDCYPPGTAPQTVEAELEKLRNQIADRSQTITLLKRDISEAEAYQTQAARLREINEILGRINRSTVSQVILEESLKDHLKQVASETERLKQTKTEYDKLVEAANRGTCYACGHKVDQDLFNGEIERLKQLGITTKEHLALHKKAAAEAEEQISIWKEIDRLTIERDKLGTIPATNLDLQSAKTQFNNLELEVALANQTIEKLKTEQRNFEKRVELSHNISLLKAGIDESLEDMDLRGHYQTLQTEYKKIQKKQTEIETELNARNEAISRAKNHNAMCRARAELNRKIEANNAKLLLSIDQKQVELAEAEGRVELLKTWIGILGPRGYRTARISKFLNSLNLTMCKYAKLMCNGKIVCRFYLDDKGEIQFEITDEAKTQDISLWSGGETARIKIVCLFAVLELLEVMGSVSFNVLCLDEVFEALDGEGKDGLFKVLEYLKGKNKAIYTIAHTDLALDLVYDSVVQAKKLQDGTTRILQ